MRKNVLVVGVPRSGTSMAAHIFARKGYFVAEEPENELREGDEFNPSGYWEANRLIEANVDIFKAVQYAEHNTWMFAPIAEAQAVRIPELERMPHHRSLVETYNAHAPWIWKDPRLCYTLGYWWPLMNPRTTAVLLLTRNVDDVFRSYMRVGWRTSKSDRNEVGDRVSAHMTAARRAIQQFHIPHLELPYEDFAKRPEDAARKISGAFGVGLSAADLFFDEKLNHGSAKGRLVMGVEQIGLAMPGPLRKLLRRFTPAGLWKRVFPGRAK